jgi:Chaperone of endosialidase/Secretion system C-terminal sorting domain
MKKIFTAIFVITCLAGFSQIKVYTGGNVSIGSTSTAPPSGFKLQLVGNSVFSSAPSGIVSSGMIRGTNAYSSATTPDFTWWGNDQVGIFHPASNVFAFTVAGVEAARFDANKNLCIGTPNNIDGERVRIESGNNISLLTRNTSTVSYSYAHKFHVMNNLIKTLTVINNNVDKFYVYGNGQANSAVGFVTFSDLSLKENLDTLRNSLNIVTSLKGYTYNYRSDPNRRYMGFIAQDVEQLIPEVVTTFDDGLKGIFYQNMIPIMVEAIKEQNKKIVELEKNLKDCCAKGKMGMINENNNSNDVMNSSLSKSNSKLFQNVPNPFNSQTTIEYYIPSTCTQASIIIFDMQGKLIKTIPLQQKENGNIRVDAGSLQPGMYMYTLVVDSNEIDTKRMILTE